MNDEGYQQLLEQLKIEHRDLDDAINALRERPWSINCRLRA